MNHIIPIMAVNMDCFVDEVKDGGKITALGVLILESGILEGLHRQLEKPIAKRVGCGAKVGEIHWSKMGDLEADVAKEWLSYFFSAPCTFFVACTCLPNETKSGAIQRLVESLEADPRVCGGLSRQMTTVHVDFDSADPSGMLHELRRNFGLLRAFKWDSKGSRLLQLCDVLLGVAQTVPSTIEAAGKLSQGQKRRNDVVVESRRIAIQSPITQGIPPKYARFLIFDACGMRHVFPPKQQ